MRIKTNLKSKEIAASYSESLLRGAVLNQKLSLFSNDVRDTINFNSACVFFTVSFLEAKINEIISTIVDGGSSNENISKEHWALIKQSEKNLK